MHWKFSIIMWLTCGDDRSGDAARRTVLHGNECSGCRHNVVVMDSAQCSASWESEIARPWRVGYEYELIPIRSAGAFILKWQEVLASYGKPIAMDTMDTEFFGIPSPCVD